MFYQTYLNTCFAPEEVEISPRKQIHGAAKVALWSVIRLFTVI